jgi:protoporphyrinogen oxidase
MRPPPRQSQRRPEHVLILGAGPAGLMAGLELARGGCPVTVLERAPEVGGLSGSRSFHAASGEYRFDYGGHRFITASRDLLALVEELLGNDLLVAERSSVIRFRGRTYAYPLEMGNLLWTAPPSLLAGALRDLARIALRPGPRDASFADWIESRFGTTLYRAFFEGYTRKLWGIDPRELSADWADQRISLVDLRDVARRLVPFRAATPRTYARRYRYPRTGFGLLFQRLAERLVAEGGALVLGAEVRGIELRDGKITSVHVLENGHERVLSCDQVVSTLPMPDLVRMTGGESALRFRGLRFLNLVMDMPDVSPFTWQYLSDPEIAATRLQEPRRRSPFMAPPGKTSIMLEIPCDPGDALWSASDAEVYDRALSDLERLGVDVTRATGEHFSTRARTAYPFMDLGYREERARAIAWLGQIENLSLCGRQGTFRYIFSDTAMEMGIAVARTLLERPGVRPDVLEMRNEHTVIEAQSVA